MKKWLLAALAVMCIGASVTSVHPVPRSDEDWLALNIWHEARGEPYHCQVAVGEVTLRRVVSPYYPDNVRDVVLQPWQFSWTIGKQFFKLPSNLDEQRRAAREASQLYYTTNELHYARYDIDNYWTRTMIPTYWCGDHIFYDNGGSP